MADESEIRGHKPYTRVQKIGLAVITPLILVVIAVGVLQSCRTQDHTVLAERFLRNSDRVTAVVGDVTTVTGFKGYIDESNGLMTTKGKVTGTRASIDVSVVMMCDIGGPRTSRDGPPACSVDKVSFYDPDNNLVEFEPGFMDNFWLLFK